MNKDINRELDRGDKVFLTAIKTAALVIITTEVVRQSVLSTIEERRKRKLTLGARDKY